ncbi:MAG: hypothetical protein E2600_07000 [Chryseobacterium sp.]|nr:hypothetical protein [Chryseobacterium sp.]
MKRFIKSVIFFSFFLLLVYSVLTVVTGRLLPGFFRGNIITDNKISAKDGSKARYLSVNNFKNADILVLGSSHAYRGYDPRVFRNSDYKMYNLGSSAQSLSMTEFIYKNYINIFSPKKIIVDIYPILLGNSGEENLLNLIPVFYNNKNFINTAVHNFDIRVINSLVYFQIFGNPKEIKSSISKDDTYIEGGYISTNRVNKENKSYKNETLKIDDKNIDALKNIISDAKSKGIEVYLLQAPIPEVRYKSFVNNREIDSLMNSLGKYYNFNNEKFLTNDYFFDDSHINQKGVDVYNKWVLKKINEK